MLPQPLIPLFTLALFLLMAPLSHADNKLRLSDDDIAKIIIQESIANYPGPCACPYNTMRNGRSCGKRSAYRKPGGEAPVCYREDITEEAIALWRERQR